MEHSHTHFKRRQAAAVALVASINLLFSYKYLSRLDNAFVLIAGLAIFAILPAAIVGVYGYANHKRSGVIRSIVFSPKIPWILLALFVVAAIVFFNLYPQRHLRIDRFEMINLFWDNAFSNQCPYCPRSADTNVPGPFPFYFYFALPWYLIGETGYNSLLGVVIFVCMVVCSGSLSKGAATTVVLLLLSSPAVIYEVAARRTILLNSVLILLLYIVLMKTDRGNRRTALIAGCLSGMVLSTRSLAFMLVVNFFIFHYRKRIFSGQMLLTGFVAGLVFAITFIPVLLLCGDTFLQYNPFAVQTSLLPAGYGAALAAASFLSALFIRQFRTFCWFSGILCLALFAGHLYLYRPDFYTSIMNSGVDISYTAFAIPFLLYSLFGGAPQNPGMNIQAHDGLPNAGLHS